jgi:hypothetical protein
MIVDPETGKIKERNRRKAKETRTRGGKENKEGRRTRKGSKEKEKQGESAKGGKEKGEGVTHTFGQGGRIIFGHIGPRNKNKILEKISHGLFAYRIVHVSERTSGRKRIIRG